MKKIGVDMQAVCGKPTGLGIYTKNLTDAISRRIPPSGNGDEFQFYFYKSEVGKSWRTPDRLLWENVTLFSKAKKDHLDILHIPAFAAPIRKPAKLVVTVHDLIGMLFPNQIGLASRWYWGTWLPWTVRRADAIIADSENTRQDIIRCLKVPPQRIRVIYPSGHEGFSADVAPSKVGAVKERFQIRNNYFLFVGTIEPRKNLARVIRAFAEFRNKVKWPEAFQLVIVGSMRFAHGKYFHDLSREVSMKDVVLTDYVDHDTLNALYCGCEAFLYPSLYEGFGIPILEAMASGTPVISSSLSSTPEVAGNAALLVDPTKVQDIAAAMQGVVEDRNLRNYMILRGQKNIQRFSWAKTAAETLDLYRAIA